MYKNSYYVEFEKAKEEINNIKSLKDLMPQTIINKSNVLSVIDNYLIKYKIQSLDTVTEMFNDGFSSMLCENENNAIRNMNYIEDKLKTNPFAFIGDDSPYAGRDKTRDNFVDVNKKFNYVYAKGMEKPTECEKKDGFILVYDSKKHYYLHPNTPYILLTCSPKTFELKIFKNDNNYLNINSSDYDINIYEQKNGKEIKEEFYIAIWDGWDVYHKKASKLNNKEENEEEKLQ